MTGNNPSLRSSRKLAHLEHTLVLPDGPCTTGLEDVQLIHRCLPELAWEEVDISTSFLGLTLAAPFYINAMTGGAHDVTRINRSLARVAAETGLAMAVGSQTAGLEDPEVRESFEVVREENPKGIIWGNVGAHVAVEDACRAVDMVEADLLQLHLNPAQELIMPEGERDFRGLQGNIELIARQVPVPVIVKEVGCGISGKDALELMKTGCSGLDIGGSGGTNFLAIEQARRKDTFGEGFLDWGIPTAISLIEVIWALRELDKAVILASGGIRSSLDIAKSLTLGANAVGIAAPFLRVLASEGEKALFQAIETKKEELRAIMLLSGATDIRGLQRTPVVITGKSAQWLESRNIPFRKLACR